MPVATQRDIFQCEHNERMIVRDDLSRDQITGFPTYCICACDPEHPVVYKYDLATNSYLQSPTLKVDDNGNIVSAVESQTDSPTEGGQDSIQAREEHPDEDAPVTRGTKIVLSNDEFFVDR